MDITDTGTPSSGINRGVYLNYTQNGVKTGSAEVDVLSIDLALLKAVTYAYAISLYYSQSGNPVLGFVAPMSIYMDDLGTNCAALVGIDVGIAQNNAPADRFCFMRLRKHGSLTVTDGIRIEGSNPLTNLMSFEIDHTPIVDAGVGGNQDKKIRVRIVNASYYIPLHSA
jgi:hypothetical protein